MVAQKENVTTRRELLDLLEIKMKGTYNQLKEFGQAEKNENYVKTYLLEFNSPGISYENIDTELLTKKLTIPSFRSSEENKIPVIEPTDDDGLYIAKWGDNRGSDIVFYLDTILDRSNPTDRRFWAAHSVSKASKTDGIVNKLSLRPTPIDRVWLWPKLLQQIQKKGQTRSVNLVYNQTYFDPDNKPKNSKKQARALFKDEALELWEALRQIPENETTNEGRKVRDKLVESKVGITYRGSLEEVTDQFAIEDINFDGKFTAKGTSAILHQEITNFTKNRYQEKVEEIEGKYLISGTSGEALYFIFNEDLAIDLNFFCERVFSGGPPFYIWGVPEDTPLGRKGKLINAVDVGTGSKMFFQLYDDMMSLNLRPGACGNSVVKFFVNLQQIYGSCISAEAKDGQPIF